MDCNNKEQIYLGEDRWLRYSIVSCTPEPQDFTIEAATYSIPGFGEDGGDLAGDCIIDDKEKTIKIKVKPVKTGTFTVTFTLVIADEIIKMKVRLHVC